MLQNKFEMPLDLAVKPSKIFYSYLLAIFLLSSLSLFGLTSFSVFLSLILFFILIMMTLVIVKKTQSQHISFLRLNSKDEWSIKINEHNISDVKLSGECIVTYFLVWLNFSTCNSFGRKKVYHLLLLPDSADRDLLRQLRVRLRFLSKKIKNKQEHISEDMQWEESNQDRLPQGRGS